MINSYGIKVMSLLKINRGKKVSLRSVNTRVASRCRWRGGHDEVQVQHATISGSSFTLYPSPRHGFLLFASLLNKAMVMCMRRW